MSHHIRDIYFILLHYSIIIHQKGIWVSLRQRGGSLGFLTGRCWMADSTYDSNHFWQCLGALSGEHIPICIFPIGCVHVQLPAKKLYFWPVWLVTRS